MANVRSRAIAILSILNIQAGKAKNIPSAVERLSRICLIQSRALPYLKIMDQKHLSAGHLEAVASLTDESSIHRGLIEQILFGGDRIIGRNLQEVLKVEDVVVESDGQLVVCQIVLMKKFVVSGNENLLCLADGKMQQIRLAPKENDAKTPASVAEPNRKLSNVTLKGIQGSPGYGFGVALHLFDWEKGLDIRKYPINEAAIEAEILRFRGALEKLAREFESKAQASREAGNEALAQIMDAQVTMVRDQYFFADHVEQGIREEKLNAEHILHDVISKRVKEMEKLTAYFADRAKDLKWIGYHILGHLLNVEVPDVLENITDDVVLVANDIGPGDASSLTKVKDHIKGMVVEVGGTTAHAAIVARSLGIPLVMGVSDAAAKIQDEDKIAVMGSEAAIIVNPEPSRLVEFSVRAQIYRAALETIHSTVAGEPCHTKDGVRVHLQGNVAGTEELPMVELHGGESVGLYRTEFLYMNREQAPTEEELATAFKSIVMPAKIRLLDFGGDKTLLRYMSFIPPEHVTALGLRGVRLYTYDQWWEEVFRTEVRAILRAGAANSGLEIMLPMITSVEEVINIKKMIEEEKAKLEALFQKDKEDVQVKNKDRYKYNGEIKVGVMIEVPVAADEPEEIAAEAAFFSIGSNDLIQLMSAVERGNPHLAHLDDPFRKAVLWKFWRTIKVAKEAGIPVAMDGNLAADYVGALLLVGMGIDALSMIPADIPFIKFLLRSVELNELEVFAQRTMFNWGKRAPGTSARDHIIEIARRTLSPEAIANFDLLETQFPRENA